MDIGVSPEELSRCARALASTESQLKTELGKLTTEADDVFGTGWLGTTADSFRSIWQQWLTGAGESLDALRIMGELLDEARNGFQAIDRGGAASMAGQLPERP